MLRGVSSLVAASVVAWICGLAAAQGPLTTEVSYQGRLTDGGLTPTGVYDLRFRLFDDPTAGGQVGLSAFEDNVQVTGGLFTASPDFGADAFSTGKQLWVQVEVRPGASAGAFTPMLPRQQVLIAPVASAVKLPLRMTASNIFPLMEFTQTGTSNAMRLALNNPASTASVLSLESNSANAALNIQSSGSGAAFGATSASTTDPTMYVYNLATASDSGINLRVTGNTAGLLVTSTSLTAVKPGVSVLMSSTAASALGGDFQVTGNAGANAAALKGSVLGLSATPSSVGVWGLNFRGVGVRAESSTGTGLEASSDSGIGIMSTTRTGVYSIFGETTSGVVGVAGINSSPISGNGFAGVLGQQTSNTGNAFGVWATSESPTATALRVERGATTGTAPSAYVTNPSTSSNALGIHSVMTATSGGSFSAAVRAESKSTTNNGIGVWGSHAGTGYGVYGTAAAGGYAVAGSAATDANDTGWAGYFTGQVYISSQLGIGVTTPAFPIEHVSGARLTTSGVWTNASDRNLKENIAPVDPADVLARVVSMPVSIWNYKVDAGAKHIGPMAQDFKQAFGLGDSDKVIGTVDADGVALAAIQGLNRKLEAKDAELAALKTQMKEQNEANEARIKAMEEAIATLMATQTADRKDNSR